MKRLLILCALALAACATQPTTGPQLTKEQQGLQAAEATLGVLKFAAEAYEMLPACGKMPCQDMTISPLIDKALAGADAAAVAAQVPIFGCSEDTWRQANAVPPTATCGTPAQDQSVQSRALTDALAALAMAKTVIPLATQ